MKNSVWLLICILMTCVGCTKKCWHCTAIEAEVYEYVKGNDTVIVQIIESSNLHIYSDSFEATGYTGTWKENLLLPADFDYCNEGTQFKPFKHCTQ